MHERYSLSLDMPISYVKSICRSLGTDEHFMYYELRIPLSNFGNDELLKDTFGKMIDRFGKLVFTISSMIDPMLVKMVQ